MSALPRPRLESELIDTMYQLVKVGFSLLPLGGGEDGKAPLQAFNGRKFTLNQVFGPMGAQGSAMYGIRLPWLVVLDCDEDDPGLVHTLEKWFGPASMHVRTPRGRHLWYRAPDGSLPNLRAEGLPVDVKSGINAYVAGPGSVRPDGGRYILVKGDLTGGPSRLSILANEHGRSLPVDVPELRAVARGQVPEGSRHLRLVKQAVEVVSRVHSFEELIIHLRIIVDRDFTNPSTMPDQEIVKIADWAWGLRLKNSLWGSDHSTFRMSRESRAAIKGRSYGIEAWWLYSTLVEAHGHLPGKTFVLKREAMNETGLGLSDRAFLGARKLLVEVGLLHRAKAHRVGIRCAQWQLGRGPT